MQTANPLIRTKLHLPLTRSGLVSRPRLQAQIAQGLLGPLTLITAPAGFGKTTLVAASLAGCRTPVAWLSLDQGDNQVGSFLIYLLAALQGIDHRIGSEASQLMAGMQQTTPEVVLSSLINDLDRVNTEMILVLDDYQMISSQAVHEGVAFFLDHCPHTFHLLIVTRSDPPLPLARLRGRGQLVELRAADLRFTVEEAAQFLNDGMGLGLDTRSVDLLEERTEGWVAGLQMAALSMRNREDVLGFIEGFSGTNRYILDYLMEEVLANQPPEIQHFLLYTSILERLTAPLCDAIIESREWRVENSQNGEVPDHPPLSTLDSRSLLEYIERANLFLVSLDDERKWYRYHHLFADLLRTQLQKSLGDQGIAQLHLRASVWYEQNSLTLEAIYHASLASDFERIERLIEQNYIEMMNHGEMSRIRFWMGKLSKELVYRRPWLCLYDACSRAWFGELEEANLLLDEAKMHIRSKASAPDKQPMLGYYSYVQSRVTAMQGDTRKAIEYCLTARDNISADNLGLQIEACITLGFEYFLCGDFENAYKTLHEMIRLSSTVRAINNPVAGYVILARMKVYQGQLREAYDLLQKAMQLIQEADGQYLGAIGLVDVGIAELLCEWNDLEAAFARLKEGLDYLPWWGKTDDFVLAYTTLARIQLARGNQAEAVSAIEKAARLIQTRSVFSEARNAVETAQVKLWLQQGDWPAVNHWSSTLDKRFGLHDHFQYEDEMALIAQARVFIAQDKFDVAIQLLSRVEEAFQTTGRQDRLIKILILKSLAMQSMGDTDQADFVLTKCLELAEPGGYVRVFLDEGQPMQMLLTQWLAHASSGSLRDYAIHLLSQFDVGPLPMPMVQEKVFPTGDLVEPLTPRELEVLQLICAGDSNQAIADKLVITVKTVKKHTGNILGKLGVTSRMQAMIKARQIGLLMEEK